MSRKIYVVGGSSAYANWMQGFLTGTMEEADLVVFTGGEDVDPSLYGAKRHPLTGSNIVRDTDEIREFRKAKALGKHIIGICRGSQFVCVMNGGILVQDQKNPAYIHPITTLGGKIINVTSTHHQAQFPFNLKSSEYKLIGWTENASSHHEDGSEQEMNPYKEAEIVFYPPKCLGIQSHPEHLDWQRTYPEDLEYFRNLLNDFLNNKL